MSIPKVNETPEQRIKRLEQELSDKRLKTEILNRNDCPAQRKYAECFPRKPRVFLSRK